MKLKSVITIAVAAAFLSACATAPRKDFEPKRKIQIITVTDRAHIYAQDDTILRPCTVDNELSKMNDQWKKDLEAANAYHAAGVTTFITEVAALAICVAQNNTANVIGWCSGSIAMGVATYLFMGKADERRFQAIDGYNHSSRASTTSLMEQELGSR